MWREVLSVIGGAGRALGRTFSVAPPLLLKRRKALGIFEKGLQAQGLDPKAVEELTALYKELGNLEQWLPNSNK
jgi:hypothetical protein